MALCTTWGSSVGTPASAATSSTDGVRSLWTEIFPLCFVGLGVSRVSRETGDSVDGHNAPEPVTLRHVDSGEWRYGQDDERPWTEPATETTGSSDLWAEHDA